MDDTPSLDPAETREVLEKALQQYPTGVKLVFPYAQERLITGAAIFHASYACERYGKEILDQVMTKLYRAHGLEGVDIPHAASSIARFGIERTETALSLGFRRVDIPYAAEATAFWPTLAEGETAMKEMVRMLRRVRADLQEEDIRHAALTARHLDLGVLERALRDRHEKNDREPWLRGASIALVAFCYRLSAPHTGPAIDECRRRGIRREHIGKEVLRIVGARFGKTLSSPSWLTVGSNTTRRWKRKE